MSVIRTRAPCLMVAEDWAEVVYYETTPEFSGGVYLTVLQDNRRCTARLSPQDAVRFAIALWSAALGAPPPQDLETQEKAE